MACPSRRISRQWLIQGRGTSRKNLGVAFHLHTILFHHRQCSERLVQLQLCMYFVVI